VVDDLAAFPSLTYKRTSGEIFRGESAEDERPNSIWK